MISLSESATMEEPNVSQVSSFPLPPMPYASMYTEENIVRHLAPPPPPPIQGHYTVFGVVSNTDDPIIQPLEAHGIRRLYASAPSQQQQQQTGPTPQIDRKAELKKLNHSILAAYLDLLELLIRSPMNQTERERKLEDLQLLFINFHHLINEYRPHQARETLKLMLEVQAQERLNVVRRFQRHFDAVVNNLQQCLKDIPDDLLTPVAPPDERQEEPMETSEANATKQGAGATTEKTETESVDRQKEKNLDWLMCRLMDDGGSGPV